MEYFNAVSRVVVYNWRNGNFDPGASPQQQEKRQRRETREWSWPNQIAIFNGWCHLQGSYKCDWLFLSSDQGTIHTNPLWKQNFFENALQTRGIWKHRLCIFLLMENILKKEHFDNDVVMVTMPFPCPKMISDCCVFKFFWCSVDGKHYFGAFSEWKCRFSLA